MNKNIIMLKENIKKLLRESLLLERLIAVDEDVDLLYNMYFKKDIDELNRTGILTDNMFKLEETDTSILKTELAIKANKMNPCKIFINNFYEFTNNFYSSEVNIISLLVHKGAISFLKGFDGNIKLVKEDLLSYHGQKTANNFITEFSEKKIKGTIHHELAHWIDDTINNRHLGTKMGKWNKLSDDEKEERERKGIFRFGKKPDNASYIEIQGQIHNIKQYYEWVKRNESKYYWDNLSFDDLLASIPSLNVVYDMLNYNNRVDWVKNLKIRMAREGLLGKNMK